MQRAWEQLSCIILPAGLISLGSELQWGGHELSNAVAGLESSITDLYCYAKMSSEYLVSLSSVLRTVSRGKIYENHSLTRILFYSEHISPPVGLWDLQYVDNNLSLQHTT